MRPRDRNLLVVIFLGGACLRLVGLDIQSLWLDELFSWRAASLESVAAVWESTAHDDVHPPGYELLLHAVVRSCGDSGRMLRLPSAIAGCLAVLALYWLGRRLYSSREGLFAAAMLAVSWAPLYYSQEARSYSLLLLFAILSAGCWWNLIRRLEDRERRILIPAASYVVVAIMTSYLHYFGLLLVAIFAALGLLHLLRRGRAMPFLLLNVVVAAGFAPWIPALLLHTDKEAFWLEAPTLNYPIELLRFFYSRSGLIAVLAMLCYGGLLVHSVRWWRRSGSRPSLESPSVFLALWLVLPVAISLLVSLATGPIVTHRNLLLCMPPALLLLARALGELVTAPRRRLLCELTFVALSLGQVLVGKEYYSKPRKEQRREVVQLLLDQESEEPLLILASDFPFCFDYYFEKSSSPRRVMAEARTAADLPRLVELLARHGPESVGLLSSHFRPEEEVLQFLQQRFASVQEEQFRGARLWLYQSSRPFPPH